MWREDEIVKALRDDLSPGNAGPPTPAHAAADAKAGGAGVVGPFLQGLNKTLVENHKEVKHRYKELRLMYGTYRVLLRSYQALVLLQRLKEVHHLKIKVSVCFPVVRPPRQHPRGLFRRRPALGPAILRPHR